MKLMFIIICAIFLKNIFSNLLSYCLVSSWIKKEKICVSRKQKFNKYNMYIIIPVYNEQKIISKTLTHFEKISKISNVKVVFVTTSKEKSNVTTNQLIKTHIFKNNLNNKILLFNYSGENGVMAHQVNYGLKEIRKLEQNKDFIIGVYNADSIISENEIYYIKNKFERLDDNICFQQYSWYSSKSGNFLLKQGLAWQNRWSVLFEFGRLLKQQIVEKYLYKNVFRNLNELFFEKMNYVIGHGLFIKSSTLKLAGDFPEETINEDAFLGLILNNLRVKIMPIPYFECAEFAPNLSVYIKQQAVWYNGPAYAFQYIKLFKTDNYFRSIMLAFKLFLHSIYWLFAPYVFVVAFSYLAWYFFGSIGILVVLLLNYFNLWGMNYLSYLIIKQNERDKKYFYVEKPQFLFSIIQYFVHSFGPIINISRQVRGINLITNKYKTER